MNASSLFKLLLVVFSTMGLCACEDSGSGSSKESEKVVQQMAGAYLIHAPIKNELGIVTGEFYEELGWIDFTLYDTGSEPKVTVHIQTKGNAEEEIEGTYGEDSETKQRAILFSKGDLDFQVGISSYETSVEGVALYSGSVSRVTESDRTNAGGFFLTHWNGTATKKKIYGTLSPIGIPDSISGQWVVCSIDGKVVGSVNTKSTIFNVFLPLTGTLTTDSLKGAFSSGTFEASLSELELEGFAFDSKGAKINTLKGQIESR